MNITHSQITRCAGQVVPKLILALFVLIALTLLTGMYLGQRAAYRDINADPGSINNLSIEVSGLREELQVALDNLQIQTTRHEVDSRALDMVRGEMAAQKQRTEELETDLRFYRSLVEPDDKAGGLSLRQPELVPSGKRGRFNYRIVIQQKARKHKMVEGSLSARVFGYKLEEEVSYPLSELSEEFRDGTVALNFRYFQSIEGGLFLPEDFEPRGITVVAHASKPSAAEVREQFPWQLQERFTHVGK